MNYTYVLQSQKDHKLYIGHTNNISRRIEEHNNGKAPATSWRRPMKLIYYEAHLSEKDSIRREHYFKTTAGKRALKFMLKDYFSTSE